MEVVPTIFAIVLVVLTIIMSVVGIHMVLVLLELKRTLRRVNAAIDSADEKIKMIVEPLQKISGIAMGMGTGLKVFEAFIGWLHRDKEE